MLFSRRCGFSCHYDGIACLSTLLGLYSDILSLYKATRRLPDAWWDRTIANCSSPNWPPSSWLSWQHKASSTVDTAMTALSGLPSCSLIFPALCHPPPEATRRLPKTATRARATVNCSSPNWRSINIARAAARLTHYLIEKAFNSRLIYRTLTSLQCWLLTQILLCSILQIGSIDSCKWAVWAALLVLEYVILRYAFSKLLVWLVKCTLYFVTRLGSL